MYAPSNLLMNGCVLKGSKSSVCSPVPINIIGLFVAATLNIQKEKGKNIYYNIYSLLYSTEINANENQVVD